jgi:hypothetical protein
MQHLEGSSMPVLYIGRTVYLSIGSNKIVDVAYSMGTGSFFVRYTNGHTE